MFLLSLDALSLSLLCVSPLQDERLGATVYKSGVAMSDVMARVKHTLPPNLRRAFYLQRTVWPGTYPGSVLAIGSRPYRRYTIRLQSPCATSPHPSHTHLPWRCCGGVGVGMHGSFRESFYNSELSIKVSHTGLAIGTYANGRGRLHGHVFAAKNGIEGTYTEQCVP